MTYRQRPRLREEIRSLMFAIGGATAKPSSPQSERIAQLQEETRMAMTELERIINTDIEKLNN